MKKLKYLLCAAAVVATLFACSEDKTPVIPPVVPPVAADYPESTGTEGKIEIYVKFATAPCNDVVFMGSYLDAAGEDVAWSSDDVARLAHFVAVPKFAGWFKAVITPKEADENGMVAVGKPVQLASDGTFNWAFQWGTGTADTGVEFYGDTDDGSVAIEVENSVEPKLNFTADAKVVYLTSAAWKSNPCVTKNEAGEATINLTCPAIVDGGAISIAGNLTDKSWQPGTSVMTKTDDTHYTITLTVPAKFLYKYTMSPDGVDWAWDYQAKDAEGADYSEKELDPSMTANDTVIAWGTKTEKPAE